MGFWRRLIDEDIGTETYWRDRIEVLEQVLAHGAPGRLDDYLRARNRLERGGLWLSYRQRIRAAMASIAADPKAGFLRAHALYAIAAIDWADKKDPVTAREFGDCARLYPQSPRAEPALIMAARTLLWDKANAAQLPRFELQQGRWYATMLLTKYPHSRFRANALGWVARVEYLTHRYGRARAFYRRQLAAGGPKYGTTESIADCYYKEKRFDQFLVTYLRMYAACKTPQEKEGAASYVMLGVADLAERDVARFCRMMRSDISLLQPYLEYRLYFTHAKRKDLANLVNLALAALRRHPYAKLSPAVWARLSEIGYLLKRYRTAYRFACNGIREGSAGSSDVDLAWYVKGSALSRMGASARGSADLSGVAAAISPQPSCALRAGEPGADLRTARASG